MPIPNPEMIAPPCYGDDSSRCGHILIGHTPDGCPFRCACKIKGPGWQPKDRDDRPPQSLIDEWRR